MKSSPSVRNTQRCPVCSSWIECRHGRRELDEHMREQCGVNRTVLRGQLWGAPVDTHKTETELNGFKATQGRML